MNTTITRSRWAAIGAAVAVTLGAGGIGLVSATSPPDAVAYVPITPCRVADTRPQADFNTGPRNTPIAQNETHTITAHGNNGDCTGIPTTATGVQLNVTALNATTGTFLTIWGSGARPDASHLNPGPGQPPAPNAVTSGLTAAGVFDVYNAFGNVDVIVDIVGYYTDHNHDDRYYTDRSGCDDVGGQFGREPACRPVDRHLGPGVHNRPSHLGPTHVARCLPGCAGRVEGSRPRRRIFSHRRRWNGSATIALSLDGTNFVTGSLLNQNFDSSGQFREPYATTYLFTVDAGTRTFYEVGSASHTAGVSAAQNNLIAESVSVDC